MKKFIFFISAAVSTVLFIAGCNNSAPVQNTAAASPAPAASPAQKTGDELSVASHSTENQFPPAKFPGSNSSSGNGDTSSNSASASGGGSPMARPVDVSAMTKSIERLEKAYKKTPGDLEAKTALADAYFNRATALTEAAQYRAALGDFRKGLKLNPDDADARAMHDQIISIFKSIGREPPKEGEEPPPLPFK
jgi:hypothetical protein